MTASIGFYGGQRHKTLKTSLFFIVFSSYPSLMVAFVRLYGGHTPHKIL